MRLVLATWSVVLSLLLTAGQAGAQTSTFCASGASPRFVFGFAELKTQIGAAMGEPVTCEFPDPRGTGDVHQQTTMGLAFWRKSTNISTFTNGSEHWALTDSGLVRWTGESIDPPSAATQPAAAAPASSSTSGSSSAVLLPAPGLAPFASLSVGSVEAAQDGYRVVYGINGGASAVITGQIGRQESPGFSNCVSTALYCSDSPFVASSRPTEELFRGLMVKGQPGTVTHITCCNGLYWTVQWYDPSVNVTYSLSLQQDVAQAYGATISPSNRAAAQRLVALAEQLSPQ